VEHYYWFGRCLWFPSTHTHTHTRQQHAPPPGDFFYFLILCFVPPHGPHKWDCNYSGGGGCRCGWSSSSEASIGPAPLGEQKKNRRHRKKTEWGANVSVTAFLASVAVVLMGSALMVMIPKSTSSSSSSSTHPELHGGALATLTTQSPIATNNSASGATMVPTMMTNTSFLSHR
jgi:hypothetical protein